MKGRREQQAEPGRQDKMQAPNTVMSARQKGRKPEQGNQPDIGTKGSKSSMAGSTCGTCI
jgi:hypothetical protein